MTTGTDLIHAGEVIERLAQDYNGMVVAAAALKGIGSLKNHLEELNAKRGILIGTVATLEHDIADANDALEAVRSKIEHEQAQARVFAEDQKASAQAEADAIITRANEAAESVKAAALVTATAIADAAKANADEAFDHLQYLLVASDKAREDRAAAMAERDAAQEKYDKIQEAIKAITGPVTV